MTSQKICKYTDDEPDDIKYTDDEPEDMQVYRWRARWYESIQMTSQMIWKYTDDEPEDMKVYRWRARWY